MVARPLVRAVHHAWASGAAPRDTERVETAVDNVLERGCRACSAASVVALLSAAPMALAVGGPVADPWADEVVGFDAGAGGAPGFDLDLAALGEPSRFTGEGFFPSVVSPFSPPYMPDEIVSIGAGGSIVLRFDEPIRDDPSNPFGIDLLIFGNTGFIDGAYPDGVVAGVFSDDGGVVEVSADGERWEVLSGAPDGLFPTLGDMAAGPYDPLPGRSPTDFTRPVDPTLSFGDLLAADLATLVALYDGSGGGAGFDLASTGLTEVFFVRISVPADAPADIELDAVVDVAAAGIAGDLDGDAAVTGADLGLLLAAWGTSGPGDLDGSGVVDGADLGAILASFGVCPE